DPSRGSRLAPARAVSNPLQGSGTAGARPWGLAADSGDPGLGVGPVHRATEHLPERTPAVRAAVGVPALLLPVLRRRHSIGCRVLVFQPTADGVRRVDAAAVGGAAGKLPVLHRAAGGQPVLSLAAPGTAAIGSPVL